MKSHSSASEKYNWAFMENRLIMQSTSDVKIIIFLKEHIGLLSSHERNEEETLQGCGLGWWVFKKGRGLAELKPFPNE